MKRIVCLRFFKGRNFMNWSEYGNSLLAKCKEKEVPFQACFEMTPFCNFKCNMCYIRLTPDQAKKQGHLLSTRQWLTIAGEAKRMGTIMLEITGGEAVTRPDFNILYESFIKMGYLIHLRTNGYLIQGDCLELLKKYKPRKISVTLYGASDETYQKVCGIPDGFSVVSRNILLMRAAGLNMRLSMTITKDNENDLAMLKEWANNNDLHIEPFGALVTPIRGAKRSIDDLRLKYPEEEFAVSEQLKSMEYTVSDRDSLLNPFWLCRGFGALFCISWDGHMTLCNTFTDIWEDPLTNGVEKAYHCLYDRLKTLKRPEECTACQYIEFCAACPSQLQSATGDITQTCDDVCRFARRKFKHFMLMKRAYEGIHMDMDCDRGGDIIED